MKIEDEKILEEIESYFEEQEAYELSIRKLSVASKKANDAAWDLIRDTLKLELDSYIWNKKTKEVKYIERQK